MRIQYLRWSTPYRIIVYAHVYVCESINCERRLHSQFAINRYSQLKTDLQYCDHNIILILKHYLELVVKVKFHPSQFSIIFWRVRASSVEYIGTWGGGEGQEGHWPPPNNLTEGAWPPKPGHIIYNIHA